MKFLVAIIVPDLDVVTEIRNLRTTLAYLEHVAHVRRREDGARVAADDAEDDLGLLISRLAGAILSNLLEPLPEQVDVLVLLRECRHLHVFVIQ